MQLLIHAATDYVDMMYNVLRMIVVAELLQNGWSFAIVSQSGRSGTLLEQARWGQISIPWRKTERDHSDEHVLEDVFMDEVNDASGLDDNYHFPDEAYAFEEVVDTMDVRDDGLVVDREVGDQLAP